jgi:hypothetical protein
MTSQLPHYCVHASLSTCYDWSTNQLLLLTVSTVCINQSVVSCCQCGSVFSEKTAAQQAARNALSAAGRYSAQVTHLCLGVSRFDLGRRAYVHRDFHSIFTKYIQGGHDCLIHRVVTLMQLINISYHSEQLMCSPFQNSIHVSFGDLQLLQPNTCHNTCSYLVNNKMRNIRNVARCTIRRLIRII